LYFLSYSCGIIYKQSSERQKNLNVAQFGRAPALGACLAVIAVISRNSRKAFNGADFRGFKKTQNRVDFAFDHSLSHLHAKRRKNE